MSASSGGSAADAEKAPRDIVVVGGLAGGVESLREPVVARPDRGVARSPTGWRGAGS